MGPLQFMVIGFEGDKFGTEIMPHLDELRERSLIRVLDLVFITKDSDGSVARIDISDLSEEDSALLASLDQTTGDWFAHEDVQQIGENLPHESSVAVVLLEHLWAKAFNEATRKAKGKFLAQGMLPEEVANQVESLLAGAGA